MTGSGSGDFSIGSDVWPGTSKLIEEMGELQQVLGKLMGTAGQAKHWDGSDLRQRLIEEIADVTAALEFFTVHNLRTADNDVLNTRIREKYARFCEWQHAEDPPPT